MAWKNGYYYRSRRKGDQVLSEYIGTGYAAELIALFDEQEREQARAKREAFRRKVTADRGQQKEIDAVGQVASDIVAAVMLLAGYHKHKRQWRRDRNVEAITVKKPVDIDFTADQLNAIIAAVDAGRPTKAQREALAQCFARLPELAQAQGDAIGAITARLVKSIHGAAGQMAAGYHLANLKTGLGYDGAPALEQMLIEHILVCWVRLPA